MVANTARTGSFGKNKHYVNFALVEVVCFFSLKIFRAKLLQQWSFILLTQVAGKQLDHGLVWRS